MLLFLNVLFNDACQSLRLYSVGDTWRNVYGALVEWFWQGKTEVLEEKPGQILLLPPEIPRGLTWNWTRAFVHLAGVSERPKTAELSASTRSDWYLVPFESVPGMISCSQDALIQDQQLKLPCLRECDSCGSRALWRRLFLKPRTEMSTCERQVTN